MGPMWWMLAWEVLYTRGTISYVRPWEVKPDLSFYRDPEEIEKEEQASAEKAVTKAATREEFQSERTAQAPGFTAAQPEVADSSEGAGGLCAYSGVSHQSLEGSASLKAGLQPPLLRPLSGQEKAILNLFFHKLLTKWK